MDEEERWRRRRSRVLDDVLWGRRREEGPCYGGGGVH